jgi:hypothetical protein
MEADMKKAVATLVVATLALVPQIPGAAAEHGYTCTVTGAASFEPGLTSETQELRFVFKGEYSGCQSTDGASSAKLSAKGVVHDASCAASSAEGVAKIKWDNGKKTTVEFTTEDFGASVTLTGSVTKSNSEAAQSGDDAFAQLAFNADVTKCDTEEGITEAEFSGQAGGGSPS